ncbi:phosphoglycerate mutase (2,3-diphosphoglycerate-independent) [Candidatus Formimonas warabiya]|uniref:2,3-bisphosphoglycerate-independent phosphoglycerate mutase n=1 Tax=Formimonas warabiya TaxID=1761012 RepID=A0A3G1KTN8_FORW1|nr:phosphoglycerate mutase (2,3-diphosphoglycerate-independent) [Candidatus Formimonas warabiya]
MIGGNSVTSQGKPLVLTILDGWGLRDKAEGNAIACAWVPNYHRLWDAYPHTTLNASEEAVGLPEGQMGNSEVGHLNMGAGRVVFQEFTRITRAIRDKSFFENLVLLKAMEHAKANNSSLHLLGLLSDGGVHSHLDHLFALLEMARRQGLTKVYVHCFLDGRDVPPANAKEYILLLQQKFKELGFGAVATVMGRFYAMDRDKRWDRVDRAYRAMVYGEGIKAPLAQVAVEQSYDKRITDEFVEPTVIVDEAGNPKGTVQTGDSIIFYNFRADRAREITRAFVDEDFSGFDRGNNPPQVHYVCMTQYDATIQAPVAFPPQNLNQTLGQVLADRGLKQLRIAETEKYAHVTFFFNGGVEEPNPGEDRILIPSPQVATYNLQPQMSAYEVTAAVIDKIKSGIYDVIILNYANPDMVGHTGMMEAAEKAVEVVDECLGKVVEAVQEQGGITLITADHGNVECMIDEKTGEPLTAHTTDQVPFILVADQLKSAPLRSGALEDIAPTMLYLLGLEKPQEMTGNNLIIL